MADSCNGDSGGGLTASNVDGREVTLGIVSFGEPDCGRWALTVQTLSNLVLKPKAAVFGMTVQYS